ncbi:2537_t:CDS:2, partial [Scutellospora calospora]
SETYANLVKYLQKLKELENITRQGVQKIKAQARYYLVRDGVLYRQNKQNLKKLLRVLRREQVKLILQALHEDPVTSYLGMNQTGSLQSLDLFSYEVMFNL